MPRELFEKLKEYLEKKRIEVALYNANIEAAKILESRTVVQEYLRLCGLKSVVPELGSLDIQREFESFIIENDFEDTNGLYVFCGAIFDGIFYYSRTVLDYPGVTSGVYQDIEKCYTVGIPIKEVEEFEITHKIISLSLEEARNKFLDIALNGSQEEASKELYKRYRLKNRS